MKIVAKKNRKLLLINTGNTQNENKAETIELTVPEEYEDYNKKIVFVTDDGIVWDIIQDNTYKLTKAITKYKQVNFYIWLTKGDVDFRSKTMPLRFYHNEDASDEITPEEIHGVNTVVNILEEEITKVDSLETELRDLITDIQNKLDNGEFDGEDGYTPQKGVDYFTEQDIEEIEGDILNEVYTKEQTDTLLDEKADIEDIPDVSSFITKDVNNLTNYTLKTNTGSLIDLEINDTTYVVTLKLKNQDGTIISTDTIDLPLESVVVSGKYDNTTKKVILTLENGSEVDFSVADLVAGLQTEITSQNKLASDLVDDTNSGNKFVTTTEKQTWNNKLDESDLTDYVKNTDYATDSKGGTIRTGWYNMGITSGHPMALTTQYSNYSNLDPASFISKGTLENVITGKQLINQTQLEDSQETQDEEIEALQTENARLKATLPTTTGEGQDITLNKTAELEFKKPPLPMGNSEQVQLTGKNLFDETQLLEITGWQKQNNIYFGNMDEWFIKYRNGFTGLNFDENTQYTISFKGYTTGGTPRIKILYSNGSFENLNFNATTMTSYSKTSAVGKTIAKIQADYGTGGANNSIYLSEFQLEEGSTATDYEHYCGGIPAPNPEYPSEIHNVGDNVNLFDGELELGQYDSATGAKLSNNSLYRNKNIIPVKPSTTYNFSIDGVNQNYVILEYKSNGDFIGQTTLNASTFTTTANTYFINFRCKSADFTSDFANLKVKLEQGTKATPYSPYGCGNVNVKVQSANIWDEEWELGGLTSTGATITETDRIRSKNYINVKPNQSCYCKSPNTMGVRFYNENKEFVSSVNGTNTTITIPANVYFMKFMVLNTTNYKNDICINVSNPSINGTYIPHQQQTFLFPLGNEKLMLGDYLADDGIHHVRGQVVLDGTEGWFGNDLTTGQRFALNVTNFNFKKITSLGDDLLSNYFKGINYSAYYSTGGINGVSYNYYNNINYLQIFLKENYTLNEFKTWLQTKYNNNTPVIVEYELNEEAIVPYTSAQQEVYNQIKQALSYEEQTNISGSSSGSNPLFSVEAYQDAKVILAEKGTYSKPSTGIPKTDLASAVQTSLNKADSALQEHQDISGKQDITDNSLNTTNKTITGAINEVNSIAKLANQAKSYSTYQAFINYLNTAEKTEFIPGQSFMIQTKLIPDLWVYSVENTSVQYTYTTDEDFITYTNQATGGQVGYYKLAQLETQKVDLTNYVTFDDFATSATAGVVKTSAQYGVSTSSYTKNLTGATRTYAQYQSGNDVIIICKGTLENVITGKNLESANNKTTTISSSSTDNEYPSAKAVYDYIQSILNNGGN